MDFKKLRKSVEDTHILLPCSLCSSENPLIRQAEDTDFYGDIGHKRVLIFETNDDEPAPRLELLQEVIKEKQERELLRISELLLKRDADFADGSTVEKFGANKKKEFSKMMRQSRLQMECNTLLQNIVEIQSFPWTKKLEIRVEFVWPESYTQGFSWATIEDENTHPIYFFMTLHAQNYMNWLKIVDSCGLVSDEVYVQVKSFVLYPKNDRALETCRRIIGDCSLLDKVIGA
jgi:hypothetical protein